MDSGDTDADASAAPVRAQVLDAVPHGFFGQTPRGDVGTAQEEREADRGRAADTLAPGRALLAARQVHSNEAVIATQPWSVADSPQADAVVATLPDVLVGVVTADCAPVLLADIEAGVVAAAHAGWRGALGGIVEASVAAMERCGASPSRIAAAIGPTIAQSSYEVDDAFRDRFGAQDDAFFAPGRAGHWQFDLEGYVAQRLHDAGVGHVQKLGVDTYANPDRYHSYRRATHRGGDTIGRQFSVIGLP